MSEEKDHVEDAQEQEAAVSPSAEEDQAADAVEETPDEIASVLEEESEEQESGDEERLGVESEIEDLSDTKVRITGVVPREKVDEIISTQWREVAQNVTLRGFRKGRVPRSLLQKRMGKTFYEELEKDLKQKAFQEAAEDNGLRIVGQPDFEKVELEEGKPFTFTVVTEIIADFALPPLEDIVVEQESYEVTDEEIEAQIETLRSERGSMQSVEDWPPKEGDMIVATTVVKASGKVFLENEANSFMVGSNTLYGLDLPELSGKLSEGEKSMQFNVTVPETHNNEKLRARKAVVEVEVQDVKRRMPAELTDAWASQFQCETVDELRGKIRESLGQQKKSQAEQKVGQDALEQIIEQVEVPLTETVKEQINRLQEQKKKSEEGEEEGSDAEEADDTAVGAEAGETADESPETEADESPETEADESPETEADESPETEAEAETGEDDASSKDAAEDFEKQKAAVEKAFRTQVVIQRLAELHSLEVDEEEINGIIEQYYGVKGQNLLEMKRRLAYSGQLIQLTEGVLRSKVCAYLSEHCKVEGREEPETAENEAEAASEEAEGPASADEEKDTGSTPSDNQEVSGETEEK